MKFIAFPGQEKPSSLWGGKARGLAALHSAGFSIPAWFVLLPAAFYASLKDSASQPLAEAELSESLADLTMLQLVSEAQAELKQALTQLCPDNQPLAVRSSALDEDRKSVV